VFVESPDQDPPTFLNSPPTQRLPALTWRATQTPLYFDSRYLPSGRRADAHCGWQPRRSAEITAQPIAAPLMEMGAPPKEDAQSPRGPDPGVPGQLSPDRA
jgi:hypothetical protein